MNKTSNASKIINLCDSSNYLNKRKDMLEYLESLIKFFNYNDAVFYFAVSILDKVLKMTDVLKFDLTLIASLLIAIKWAQNDCSVPQLSQFSSSEGAEYFNSQELKKYESNILMLLDYDLMIYTPYDYLEFFLMNGIFSEQEMNRNRLDIENVSDYARGLLRKFIFDQRYVDFQSFEIACSVVTCTRANFEIEEKWPSFLEELYCIKLSNFMICNVVLKRYCFY